MVAGPGASLTGVGALRLVVRLGAGVPLLHLQAKHSSERVAVAPPPARLALSLGDGTRATVSKPIVPLLCSREAAIFWWRCDLRRAGSIASTPTFSETFSSFNECVRSLCVKNLSIIEPQLSRYCTVLAPAASGRARSSLAALAIRRGAKA